MEASASSVSVARSNALPAILVGGIVAGALDLISAFIDFGWGVPRAIAGGVLGPSAMQGGTGVWLLGVFLHFFITCAAAAVYYAASRKLTFLTEHAFICGLFFGIAVYHVMNLIVLPLSALHFSGPFTLRGVIKGLLAHMFLVGLPIAYSVRIFDKGASR
jgi:hypothetical protein